MNLEWDQEVVALRRSPPSRRGVCVIQGCNRPHLARGWCGRHYQRWQRHGDPLRGVDVDDEPVEGIAKKPCGGCGGAKPRGRGRAFCNRCGAARREIRRDAEAKRQRNRTLVEKYGITADEYAAILLGQGGFCALCGGPPTKSFRCFDVDHDHETGEVRGLLCRRCNTGLGYIEAGFHEKALAYLGGGVLPRI